MQFLIYIFICLLIGFFGAKRKFGFWGYFFGSILLTPVIGLLLVLGSDRAK
ncbi:membrane protein [Candidatus Magnetomorum sp. HK-1]|nr:membrane protein [Candidatus Magnetomorum sp. HK-1]